MTIEDREYYKLEATVQMIKEEVARHDSDLKELLGAIKKLDGQVMVLSEHEQIHEQFRQIQTRFSQLQAENSRQSKDIGHLYGILHSLTNALSSSQDKGLAAAAKNLTINVRTGQETNVGSVTNNGGLNTVAGDVHDE